MKRSQEVYHTIFIIGRAQLTLNSSTFICWKKGRDANNAVSSDAADCNAFLMSLKLFVVLVYWKMKCSFWNLSCYAYDVAFSYVAFSWLLLNVCTCAWSVHYSVYWYICDLIWPDWELLCHNFIFLCVCVQAAVHLEVSFTFFSFLCSNPDGINLPVYVCVCSTRIVIAFYLLCLSNRWMSVYICFCMGGLNTTT